MLMAIILLLVLGGLSCLSTTAGNSSPSTETGLAHHVDVALRPYRIFWR